MSDVLTFLQSGYTPQCTGPIIGYYGMYSIALLTKNTLEIEYDDERYTMDGKWVWTVYPGPWIRATPLHGATWWEHRFANFQKPLVDRWLAGGLWLTRPQMAPPGKDYEGLFDELAAYAQKLDRWSQLRATNVMEYILLTLAEDRVQTAREQPWLEKTLRALDQSKDFAPNYELIARECNMALSSLRRNFKQATGIPLHEYVMHERMATARRLLQESDATIKAIAAQLGYRDVQYFTRQFQKLCGTTPAHYRRSGESREGRL